MTTKTFALQPAIPDFLPASFSASNTEKATGRMPEAEVRLIRRAQAGDRPAFAEILKLYEKPVFATLHRMLGGRYAGEIEDFAQEFFLKMLRALPKFDFSKKTKFSTWLYSTLRNFCIDVYKKKRISTLPLKKNADEEKTYPDPEFPGKTPIQAAADREISQMLVQAVSELPQKFREVLVLRDFGELTYGEIAEVINEAEGTVKSRLYRARDVLRKRLRPFLQGEPRLRSTSRNEQISSIAD